VKIANPNLCIVGSTTPSDLWAAFSSASTADGFASRFLVFDAGGKRPEWIDAPLDVSDPPQELMKALQHLIDVRPIGNIAKRRTGRFSRSARSGAPAPASGSTTW
jgi:hypothetical protein